MKILSVNSNEFKTYGKVHQFNGFAELEKYTIKQYPIPSQGNFYQGSAADIEEFEIVKQIQKSIYGDLKIQAGPCCGHNQILNGIEYHQGSEVAIMIRDCVMVLGHIWDMEGNYYDSSKCEAFYVPKGTVLETYGTTLHYTPCTQSDEGFYTICILLKDTGTTLENGRVGILKKKNKWFITHKDNLSKVNEGDFVGLTGDMIKIDYHD